MKKTLLIIALCFVVLLPVQAADPITGPQIIKSHNEVWKLGQDAYSVGRQGGTIAGAGSVAVNVTDAGGLGAGTYTLIDWTGAAGSLDAADFTLTLPGAGNGEISVQGSELRLKVDGPAGTLFRFR